MSLEMVATAAAAAAANKNFVPRFSLATAPSKGNYFVQCVTRFYRRFSASLFFVLLRCQSPSPLAADTLFRLFRRF